MTRQNEYDQRVLNARFDTESEAWRDLYRTTSTSWYKYNDKAIRRRYALEMLGQGEGWVLDLGCGPGGYFKWLEKLGYRVVGLDASENMVDLATREASRCSTAQALRANVLALPFADASFRGVLAVGLLEYLPSDEQFLRETSRVLEPGGRLVLTLRNAACLERRWWQLCEALGLKEKTAHYFYREHLPAKFEVMAREVGFRNISRRFCHFYPFPWPLAGLMPKANNYLANWMESRLSRANVPWLASTYLVAMDNPGT